MQKDVKALSSRVGKVEKSKEFLFKTIEENKQKNRGKQQCYEQAKK